MALSVSIHIVPNYKQIALGDHLHEKQQSNRDPKRFTTNYNFILVTTHGNLAKASFVWLVLRLGTIPANLYLYKKPTNPAGTVPGQLFKIKRTGPKLFSNTHISGSSSIFSYLTIF